MNFAGRIEYSSERIEETLRRQKNDSPRRHEATRRIYFVNFNRDCLL